jgi:hypothetical protein
MLISHEGSFNQNLEALLPPAEPFSYNLQRLSVTLPKAPCAQFK